MSVSLLSLAVEQRLITVDDAVAILSSGLQFIQIYNEHIADYHRQLTYTGQHAAATGHYIDMLLFIVELLDPKTDRLRKKRRRYETCELLWGGDVADRPLRTATESPEQLVATWSWEKALRGSRRFGKETRDLLSFAADLLGVDCPYWVFSPATRCQNTPFMLLAFDQDFRYDGHASKVASASITPAESSRNKGNPFLDFCHRHNLEMIGTPFLVPPLDAELHILAQQVLVTHRDNTIQVSIPAFYRGSSLTDLLDHDLHDLHLAMKGKSRVRPIKQIKRPATDGTGNALACALADSEMAAAAKVVRKVLRGCHGLSPYLAFRYTQSVMSFWWPIEDTDSRMTKWIRSPKKNLNSSDVKSVLPRRIDIVRMIDRTIGECELTSAEVYAWAKYYRQLAKYGQLQG